MSKESRARLRAQRVEHEWQDLKRRHIEQHERDVLKEQELNAEKLRDPAFAASLGLPPNLPEYTIGVLKRTMALARLEPTRPKADKYAADGNRPTVLHSVNLVK